MMPKSGASLCTREKVGGAAISTSHLVKLGSALMRTWTCTPLLSGHWHNPIINPRASCGPRGDVFYERSKDRLADAEKAFAWVTGQSHIGQGEVAEGAAGRQLRQELQGVAKELQGAQVRQRAQVDDGRRQPVGLQGQLTQLRAAPDLACAGAAHTL